MSPVVPQITSVTSEALQAEIRKLLPSQQGFGADLQATNVIVPIVDLTPAAEGSSVPVELQQAMALGSQTAISINNATTTLANSPGFWLFQGTMSILSITTGADGADLNITDGLSTKAVYGLRTVANPNNTFMNDIFRIVVFLGSGESVTGTAGVNSFIRGSYRQIADVNGNLVNPNGFTPQ